MTNMSGAWQVRATLHVADGELRLGLVATRNAETTSDVLPVADEAEARREARLYAQMLGASDYEWRDLREPALS